jgi:hypothetical protein
MERPVLDFPCTEMVLKHPIPELKKEKNKYTS